MSIEIKKPNVSLMIKPTPFDKDLYRQAAEQTCKSVIAGYLRDQIPPINDPKYASFLRERIPKAVSAIKLGYPLVLDQIGRGGLTFDVLDGLGIMTYVRSLDDRICFRITPSSDDPFKYADYKKAAERYCLKEEGESDLLTDPYLVREMLRQGLNERSRMLRVLAEAKNVALHTKVGEERTLNLLQLRSIPHDAFDDLDRIDPNKEIDEKALSIANCVIKVAEDVSRLGDLYRKQTGARLQSQERGVYENSLIVELLTNPEPITCTGLRTPRTTVERIFRVLQFIQRLKTKKNSWGFRYLVESTIDSRKDELEPIFVELGISPSLGLEYIQNLIHQKVRYLPSIAYVDAKDSSPDVLKNKAELNNLYNLKTPIPRPQSPSADEPVKNPHNLLGPGFFVSNFVSDSRKFSIYQFVRFPPYQQQEIFSRILENTSAQNDFFLYRWVVSFLMSKFGLKFNPKTNAIDFSQPKDVVYGLTSAAENLLVVAAARLNKNDILFIDALTDACAKELIRSFLVAQKLPPNKTLYAAQVKIVQNRYKAGKISNQEYLTTLLNYGAGFVLEDYFMQSGQRHHSLGNRVKTLIRREGWYLRPEVTPFIQTRAEALMEDFYNQTFGKDEGRRKKLTTIINASIQELGGYLS